MNQEFIVKTLGKSTIQSPLKLSKENGDNIYNYVLDEDRILFDARLNHFNKCKEENCEPLSFEKAGPREKLYFDPSKTKVAVVTCGGLCPGLNVVIRSLVRELWSHYNIKKIIGIQYGYEGFIPEYGHEFIELNPDIVENIYLFGGSILGSSRGNQDVGQIVDALERLNVNILFAVGGDGTLKGAHAIHEEIERRGLKISVAGVPKTIDNDIDYIEKTFGFDTAVTKSYDVIRDAHNEAKGAFNGIALIKLMGRDSGFIAAHASLAIQEVNFVLVPEIDFDLHGPNGFLEHLVQRIHKKKHALVVVAEGAGQFLFDSNDVVKDKSGNILHKDIGIFLKDAIQEEFKKRAIPMAMKYIDPSYIIRSAAAIAEDSKFCNQLANNAVHAALAGKTDFVVGYWNQHFTLLPISVAVKQRKKIELESELWFNVLEATGQPAFMKNR